MNDTPAQHVAIERIVDAPPELVWSMWTDAEHFAAWYGPGGAAITVVTMDVRVGGSRLLRMDMATSDGSREMWFTGDYLEVVEHQRLTYTDAMSDEHGRVLSPAETGLPADHPATTEVRVELEPHEQGTRMLLTHVGIPAGSPGAAGWAMALDQLEVRLSEIV
jgi:uncharacterized protein YndB with AHSA1/START domain